MIHVRKPFKSNITAVFVGWANIHAAIEPFLHAKWQELCRLWQIQRKLFSYYVGEKHVVLDKKRQASQKEHVLSLQCLSQLSTWSIFCRLDPIAIASTFCQLSLVRSLVYFHFWFASFASSNWSMVYVYSYQNELHQGGCLVADQLSNRVASSSHVYNLAKVVSVGCKTS